MTLSLSVPKRKSRKPFVNQNQGKPPPNQCLATQKPHQVSPSVGRTNVNRQKAAVDSLNLVVFGMCIFREAFRLSAVLFNQLSKKCYQAM